MRGVVTAGMVTGLEMLGFHVVYGRLEWCGSSSIWDVLAMTISFALGDH